MSTEQIEYLYNRLREARQARRDYEDRNPEVDYCLECDEYVLCVPDDGEYERLDCEYDHVSHIISESWTNDGITQWINCIEHIHDMSPETTLDSSTDEPSSTESRERSDEELAQTSLCLFCGSGESRSTTDRAQRWMRYCLECNRQWYIDPEHQNKNPDRTDHRLQGVGEDTRVFCPDTEYWYGPYSPASFDAAFCPYCGENTEGSEHQVDTEVREVFCPHSSQSTWRYCSHCGDAIIDES